MEFEFSEEQIAIRELAAAVFGDFCTDEKLQKFWAGSAAYDTALWQQLAASGLQALTLGEADGGSGMGMLELMLVLEQQGRALAPVPLWRQQLALAAQAQFAEPAAALTAPQVAGDELISLGLEGLYAHSGPGLRAERNGAGWTLHGSAIAVPLAAQAQQVLLPAATAAGVRLFALALPQPGVEIVPGMLTHREPAADLHCTGAVATVLAAPALAWLEPRAIACVAALQLGVAAEALRRAVSYTSERQQFGRALATFQALSQKVADAYIDVETLRSTLWQLCWRLDAGRDSATAAAVVKIHAADCGHRVSHAAQHMHGGIGVDTSYPIHRFTLWSRALESSLGSAAVQIDALGRQLAAGTIGDFL